MARESNLASSGLLASLIYRDSKIHNFPVVELHAHHTAHGEDDTFVIIEPPGVLRIARLIATNLLFYDACLHAKVPRLARTYAISVDWSR